MSSMKRNHLPLYGVGPIYSLITLLLTIIFSFLSFKEVIPCYQLSFLRLIFVIIGVLLIIIGLYIWVHAVFKSKIDDNILDNRLVTSGVYSYTRNPIYTAILFAFSGVLFIMNNLYLLILPFVYWLFLTVLMKNTEEKWLLEKYGEEYRIYCRSVNRCIPWFRKK